MRQVWYDDTDEPFAAAGEKRCGVGRNDDGKEYETSAVRQTVCQYVRDQRLHLRGRVRHCVADEKEICGRVWLADAGADAGYDGYRAVLAGAIAVNAALQVGFFLGGAAGAAVAALATILPPLLLLSAISFVYAAFRDSVVIATLLQGMQLGVGAVLLDVTCGLGKPVLKSRDWLLITVLAAAFVLSYVLGVNVMYIIPGTALIGVLRAAAAARTGKGGRKA